MRPILFFDGHCGLCNGFVTFLIACDRKRNLRFAPIPGETSSLLLPGETATGGIPGSIVLWREERVYRKSEAVVRAFAELGGLWRGAGILHAIPRGLRDALYDGVARHRYPLFGCRSACRVPTGAERERFLP